MMRFRVAAILLLSLIATSVFAARNYVEEIKLSNAGLVRLLSTAGDVLKTKKLEANGVQMLDQPSVEFLIDLDTPEGPVTLMPSDFDLKGNNTFAVNREQQTVLKLVSHYDGIPLTIYINYYRGPKAAYQQKSIELEYSRVPDVIIRRVVIEYCHFREGLLPVQPTDAGFVTENSNFGAMDAKTGKGFFVFAPPPAQVYYTRMRGLSVYEETKTPLESGYKTGRVTFAPIAGTPESLYKSYREYVLSSYYPTLSKNAKFADFKKKFATYFNNCQFAGTWPNTKEIDIESHIVDGKGFIILFNSTQSAIKATLPLQYPTLKLSGDLKLSDWTSLDAGTPLGTVKSTDKFELEIAPGSYRIIGIGVEGAE